MIYLFEKFDVPTKDLYHSLRKAHFDVTPIALDDDGFLNEEILSPYNYYTRDTTKRRLPRYFNRLEVPEFFEIRATASMAEIFDGANLRGRVFYAEPKNKRYVKIVDHLTPQGMAVASDHYDIYGHRFAQTTFNKDGKRVTKTYYDPYDREVIVENFVTGDIILNEQGRMYIYKSKVEFVNAFLKKLGLEDSVIFYNSLSVPFFVSEDRQTLRKDDVLFWQEEIGDSIPGNMRGIIEGESHTRKIIVQNPESYKKMLALGVPKDLMEPLGFIYEFSDHMGDPHKALIMTNSDHIESLEKLVMNAPEIQFYIGAITEMSSKLLNFGNYDNVHLYPNIKEHMVKKLFEECGLYLDINYANEILNALREAFLNNQVIYGFKETLHGHDYITENHIFAKDDVDALIAALRNMDEKNYREELEQQKKQANAADEQDYHRVLEPLRKD
jgi:accessory Sec system glycosyltransferase GtfB